MKKNKTFKVSPLIAIIVAIAFTACNKSAPPNTTTTTPTTPTVTPTTTPTPAASTATPPAPEILATFDEGNSKYYIINSAKTWQEAAAYAVQYGGYLAEITSEAEQTKIAAELEKVNAQITTKTDNGGGARYVWIGATDSATENAWVWNGDNKADTANASIGELRRGFTTAFGGDQTKWIWNLTNEAYQNFGRGTAAEEPDNFIAPNSPADHPGQDYAAIAMEDYPTEAFVTANNFPSAIATNIGKKYEWNDLDSGEAIKLLFVMEVGK